MTGFLSLALVWFVGVPLATVVGGTTGWLIAVRLGLLAPDVEWDDLKRRFRAWRMRRTIGQRAGT